MINYENKNIKKILHLLLAKFVKSVIVHLKCIT